ncbi:MAG: Ig-like domain-containing protein [Thermoplasmatota archaeon]
MACRGSRMRTFNNLLMAAMVLSTAVLTTFSMGQSTQMVVYTNVELVTVESDRAVATWVTNVQTGTVIRWGTDEDLSMEGSTPGSTLFHYGEMVGLEPDTKYFFAVSNGATSGDISSFRTLPDVSPSSPTRVGILADPHFDLDGNNLPNGAMYGDSPVLVGSFLDELEERGDLDMLILLGDNVQGNEEDYREFYDTQMASIDVDFHPVMGNWDKNSPRWREYFDTYLGLENTYYSFDIEEMHVVVLDSAIPGEVGGSLDDQQLDWLEEDLSQNSERSVIIFMHHLAIADDIMGLDESSCSRLMGIIDGSGNILNLFSGHNHMNTYENEQTRTSRTTVASLVQYPIGYTTLEIWDTGYSQSFHKVEETLQTSENSRVRYQAASVDPDADQELLGDLGSRNHVREMIDNTPPVIDNVLVDTSEVPPGGVITITVNAHDPEGQELEYSYSPESGMIFGGGSTVSYEAPLIPGEYSIEISVFDGDLWSLPWIIDIEVLEDPTPGVNQPPLILDIRAVPDRVETGGEVRIITTAEDPEGDPLRYIYEVQAGSITGSGGEVIWTAPMEAGTYSVTVRVADATDTSSPRSLDVEVYIEEPDEEGEQDSSYVGIAVLSISITVLAGAGYITSSRRRIG